MQKGIWCLENYWTFHMFRSRRHKLDWITHITPNDAGDSEMLSQATKNTFKPKHVLQLYGRNSAHDQSLHQSFWTPSRLLYRTCFIIILLNYSSYMHISLPSIIYFSTIPYILLFPLFSRPSVIPHYLSLLHTFTLCLLAFSKRIHITFNPMQTSFFNELSTFPYRHYADTNSCST